MASYYAEIGQEDNIFQEKVDNANTVMDYIELRYQDKGSIQEFFKFT
jgi:hypothetical protein